MLLVKIINDGVGSKKKANYHVEVSVTEKGGLKVLGTTQVYGHERERGWLHLLYLVLDELEMKYGEGRNGAKDREG